MGKLKHAPLSPAPATSAGWRASPRTAPRNRPAVPGRLPSPIHCGWWEWSHSVRVTLNSTGIRAAITGGQGRSSANREREVISIRLQPTRLGPRPRKTADTSRVDSAVKLPRWKNSAMAGWRNAMAKRAAGHRRQRGQRNGPVDQAEGLAQAEKAPQARDLRAAANWRSDSPGGPAARPRRACNNPAPPPCPARRGWHRRA